MSSTKYRLLCITWLSFVGMATRESARAADENLGYVTLKCPTACELPVGISVSMAYTVAESRNKDFAQLTVNPTNAGDASEQAWKTRAVFSLPRDASEVAVRAECGWAVWRTHNSTAERSLLNSTRENPLLLELSEAPWDEVGRCEPVKDPDGTKVRNVLKDWSANAGPKEVRQYLIRMGVPTSKINKYVLNELTGPECRVGNKCLSTEGPADVKARYPELFTPEVIAEVAREEVRGLLPEFELERRGAELQIEALRQSREGPWEILIGEREKTRDTLVAAARIASDRYIPVGMILTDPDFALQERVVRRLCKAALPSQCDDPGVFEQALEIIRERARP